MISNAAVMVLLMQENQRRGGLGRDPNGGGDAWEALVILAILSCAAAIGWMLS